MLHTKLNPKQHASSVEDFMPKWFSQSQVNINRYKMIMMKTSDSLAQQVEHENEIREDMGLSPGRTYLFQFLSHL